MKPKLLDVVFIFYFFVFNRITLLSVLLF